MAVSLDMIGVLRARIAAASAGAQGPGLAAVLQHIEAASKHHARGASEDDDSAFTDAVYRCNQAFEGSLKEAYRVLADKDPAALRTYDIEKFLEDKGLLRERVLTQMTRYRTEWRNPSTHDYRLAFDEDEALLAIVSVCTFAVVLADQIVQHEGFLAGQAAAKMRPNATEGPDTIGDRLMDALERFEPALAGIAQTGVVREQQFIGALAGHISALFPAYTVETEAQLSPDSPERADILVRDGNNSAIIEIKRGVSTQARVREASAAVHRYVMLAGASIGLLVFTEESRERSQFGGSPRPTTILAFGPDGRLDGAT